MLEAFEGEPQLPKKTLLRSSRIVQAPDIRPTVLEVLQLLTSKGPVGFDLEDANALSQLSGMKLPEAKLLLAGSRNCVPGPPTSRQGASHVARYQDADAKAAKATSSRCRTSPRRHPAGALDGVSASELWSTRAGTAANWVAAMAARPSLVAPRVACS